LRYVKEAELDFRPRENPAFLVVKATQTGLRETLKNEIAHAFSSSMIFNRAP